MRPQSTPGGQEGGGGLFFIGCSCSPCLALLRNCFAIWQQVVKAFNEPLSPRGCSRGWSKATLPCSHSSRGRSRAALLVPKCLLNGRAGPVGGLNLQDKVVNDAEQL